MADQKFNFMFTSGEVMSTSVHKSQGGYNYASVNIKKGDDQYVSIGYEWKGKEVPDLAMDMLGFMQASKEEVEAATQEFAEECKAFAARLEECH